MSKGRILVVEDERIVAMDICETLENYGFSVTGCVTSGEEAIRVATREKPDLVLMDIRLGGKIDGLEAAREIQRQKWTPIVFLTAFGEQELVDQAIGIDAFGYILKPFEEKRLCVAIDLAMNRGQVERRLRQTIAGGDRAAAPLDANAPFIFKTFGGLQLLVDKRVVLRSEQLSKTQRALFGLLLSASLRQLPVETVAAALWPDSPAPKARSSFDSLILRTRRVVEAVLPKGRVDDLIVVKHSILMLPDCQSDLSQFTQLCKTAAVHLKQRHLNAAEGSLLAAIELAKEPFLPVLPDFAPVVAQRREVQTLLNNCCLQLSAIYSARRDVSAAIKVVEEVILREPLNDVALRRLVRLYQDSNAALPLRSALDSYRDALLAGGHPQGDVERLVAALYEDCSLDV
ncbi:MAG: response regulator [Desulfuromonadaceae bacterium]|nr:response regulator [Desulfuromonadaceae bacterium]